MTITAPLTHPAPAAPVTPAVAAPPGAVTLRTDLWEVDVLPGTGASLGAGRIRTSDGVWRDLLRPTRRTSSGDPEKCASFPMVPWSNRIRDGVLPFEGRRWQLQRNAADGTAIHGAVRYAHWDVVEQTPTAVTLAVDTAEQIGINFPWQFGATVRYAVEGQNLVVTTSVRNTDVEPFPAGFGHHPYLSRALLPVGAPIREYPPTAGPLLQVPARSGYRLDAALADGPAGAVPPRADFRQMRPLGSAFVDDVLTDLDPCEPVRIEYPDEGVRVDLTVDPVYRHLVLYAPRRRCYFAVEPATNVNDGFTLHDQGVPGTGVFVLEPGEERTGAFRLAVTV
ncbi:Aldose 1-epimerase [Cellulomonas flavigena DSM 20109]|uniref:Aldose 1-epimerase n=1 Tax=Cellulomonas flavigena (strain ATCC 482 / DSM 20109 / BCRC 11376 / JCM 18109 / NBRC 3775 / NCIMB 8073 / NRS 134) TaxID=446466 RepID=D5UG85_CELFN|nr:aldose 1-epimerase [Cellulomonas flavigena]ADG73068.1 Aldose 1-epimerase [Cellulomonas flavigena DSM 20109]